MSGDGLLFGSGPRAQGRAETTTEATSFHLHCRRHHCAIHDHWGVQWRSWGSTGFPCCHGRPYRSLCLGDRPPFLGVAPGQRKAGAIALAISFALFSPVRSRCREPLRLICRPPHRKGLPRHVRCGERNRKRSATAIAAPTPSATPTVQATGAPLDPDSPYVLGQGASVTAPKSQPAFAAKAIDLLATLPIKGRAPKSGYDRALFGQAWADVDRNGCDTRNDILKRDLGHQLHQQCALQGADRKSGGPVYRHRRQLPPGAATSSAVQIDHVVALSDAWQKGAQQLTTEQRTAFANDPRNLQATDGPTNMRKGDGDAATWLLLRKDFRCEYVARQIGVKATYSLWVTQAEHDAMVMKDPGQLLGATGANGSARIGGTGTGTCNGHPAPPLNLPRGNRACLGSRPAPAVVAPGPGSLCRCSRTCSASRQLL